VKASRYVASAVVVLISSFATYFYTTNLDTSEWEVVTIADGDSFTLSKNNRKETFRLYGIDCPEKTQPFAGKARTFTTTMLNEGAIRVKAVEKDTYGRTIAWVYSDTLCLNEALLENGLAWHYTYFSSDAELAALEKQARDHKSGLWSEPDPVPPWEFRHRKKQRNSDSRSSAKTPDLSGADGQL